MRIYLLFTIIIINILLSGCIIYKKQPQKTDALENFNRSIFVFNYNILDNHIVKPMAILWKEHIPEPARNSVINFLSNLEEPATIINYFIIGESYKAMIHFNRFFLNTFIGLGGLIDIASLANQKLIKEDIRRFGNTLGIYGICYGPYIQLPGYGSFTIREDIGNLVDNLYPTLSYLTWWMHLIKWIIENLEYRSQCLNSENLFMNTQDQYELVRTIYFQRHDCLVNRKNIASLRNLSVVIQHDLDKLDQ